MLLLPLAAALPLWGASLTATDPGRMTDLGLLSVLPPAFYLALALLAIGFFLALHARGGRGWLPGAYLAGWIVVVHATPSVLYGSLRYSWAWKHAGIVEYVRRTGSIDPTIDVLPVYHNWPGFFGAAALIAEAAGQDEAIGLATWAPPFFELLFSAAVLLVLRGATGDPRLAWAGTWFFAVANWVGQDYFAPQAMAYACFLVVVGATLWAFPGPLPEVARTASALGRWPLVAAALEYLRRRVAAGERDGRGLPQLAPSQRRGLLVLVVLLLGAMAVSHQLTPVATVLALSAFVLFGRRSAWGLPVAAAVLTALWWVTGASSYVTVGLREVIASFGLPEQNVEANLIDVSQFGPGVRLVSAMARGVTAAVGLIAVLGWLRRLRRGVLDPGMTLLWLAPLGLLAVSGYGGEVLFRVYFFALPAMAFFVAALCYPAPEAGRGRRGALLPILLTAALATGSLFAYYGHERTNYFRPGEVAAADFLAETAPSGSLVIEASSNYPSRHRRYEQFTYVPLVAWARGNAEESRNAYTLADIEEMMADPRYPAAFLIVSRSQIEGLSLPGQASVEDLLRQVEASDDFAPLLANGDATVYGLAERGPGGAS